MATSDIGIKIGLQGAESVTSGLQRVGASMGQLSGQVDTVRNALSTLAPTLAGALTVGGLVAFVRQTVNAVDAMNDLADATGASIEEISKLDQVARRNGQSLDQVGGMLVKFNAALKEADGKNGASIALEAIGLSAAKLRQLDPAEALRQTAVALAGFADDANKARITQELFGKSVREAAPFLNDLAEAGELNASVTAEQAAQADKFNKQIFALQENVSTAARVITNELLPTLSAIGAEFTRANAAGDTLAKFFGTSLKVVFEAVAVLATDVAFVFKGIGRDLGGMAAQIAALAKGDFAGFSFIRKALIEDSIQARKELDALQARILGVQDTMRATDTARAREDRGFVPGGPRSVIDIAGEQARRKAADDAAIQAAKARQTELDIQAKRQLANIVAYDKAEAELEEQLQRSIKAELDLASARGLKSVAAYEAAEQAIDDNLAKARQLVDAIDRETAVLQMSNVEREVSAALLELERAGLEKGSYAYDEYAQKIRESVISRESVRDSIEQTRKIEDEWRRTTDQIGQSLSDALMQGGKSAWEYIKGLFRSMVLRPIIQAVVNPVAGAFTAALGFSGAASASSGATALGNAGTLASAYNAINTGVSTAITNGFMKLAESPLGAKLGLSTPFDGGTGFTANIATSSSNTIASALGTAGGTIFGTAAGMAINKAISNGFQVSSGMNTLQNIGTAVASYMFGPIGGMVAGAISGAINRVFGRRLADVGLQGTFGAGAGFEGQSFQFFEGGLLRSDKTTLSPADTELQGALSSGFRQLQVQTALLAQTVGQSAEEIGNFTQDIRLSFKGLTEDQIKEKLAEQLNSVQEQLAGLALGAARTITETITTSVEDWEQTESGSVFRGFVDQVSEVTRTIEATGTSYARAGETNVQTLTRLAGSLSTINPALELLGLNLYATSLAGADLASQLADAFGGLENFTQATAAYYAEFFTEAERTAKTTAQLTEALGGLGLALPTTRDAYRQLVEAQDLNTEAGRKNFAVLLQLSGTFAGITPVVEDLAEASDQATEALRSAADILRERQGLERQLLQLQGDTAALRALDRAALDESNRALFDRINALQDSQAAEAAAAEATRTAAAAAEEAARAAAAETQRIGQERLGLERQLLQLQGDTATIRALERAALDESNRALFDRITALQDSQAAEAAAAEATRTAAAAAQEAARAAQAEAQRIGQERLALERQLLQLQGNTAAIRALERGALQNSNRALFDYVTALQDAQAAAAAMEASERTLADLRAKAAEEALANKQRLAQDATAATNAAFDAVRRAIDAQAAAAEAAIRSAFDLQMRNINAQKTAAEAARQVAQETLQSARPLFDFLGKQVQELSGLAGFGMSGAQGRRFVQDALTSLRATGTLPNEDRLQEAVQAARRELDPSRYASAAELRRDTLLLANSLAELQSATGQQLSGAERALSIAEQQLKTQEDAARVAQEQLDLQIDATRVNAASQLSIAQAQLNALRSIDTGILSVSDAMSRLGSAIAAETVATAAANQALAAAVLAAAQANATAAESAANIARANAATLTAANAAVVAAASIASAAQPARTQTSRTVAELEGMLPENWFRDYDAAEKIAFFNENKVTIAELTAYEQQQGKSEKEIRELLDFILANGYRGFAEGGLHTGGLRLVGERGPELEVTGPARYWSFEQTNAMFSGGRAQERKMIAQLEALRAEMEGLRAEARSTAVATNKTARILDRVTPDGTSLQTVAAT